MQVVLAGSLAFDIIDRVHGLYMGIAPDIDWSIEWMEPIYTTPGLLFIVNMSSWAVVGGFIKWLMYYIGKQASGIMSVRYKVNCKVLTKLMRMSSTLAETLAYRLTLTNKFVKWGFKGYMLL